MSVGSADLLECASFLMTGPEANEAYSRAAVSRAYYAAFHDSTLWHEKLPVPGYLDPSVSGGMHTKFFLRLLNPDTTLTAEQKKASKRRGILLRALHGRRVGAD